jgi:GNAT superfamily N-acetyltransferase
VIADYLDSLAGALSFDRALSRRVREEIEDHLHEALAANPAMDRVEAEARAIADCGNPHVIAAEFTVIALAQRSRRLGIGVMLMIAAVLVAMRARGVWYAAMQWVISDDMKPLAAFVGAIDRYASLISIVIGLGALVYVSGRSIPSRFNARYSGYLRRTRLICATATATLAVAVTGDAVLMSMRLLTRDASPACLIPISLVGLEIACAIVLIALLRDLTQRMASTAALWHA